jgi:hypothetical protein
MEIALLFMFVLLAILSLYLTHRNNVVYEFRTDILKKDYALGQLYISQTFEMVRKDIITIEHVHNIGGNWSRQFDSLPSYGVMVCQFWKPIKSYLKNTTPNFPNVVELIEYHNPGLKIEFSEGDPA